MTDLTAYRSFLAGKAALAKPAGLPCDPSEVHPALLPHQNDAVCWGVQGGRRALFESFGLGKSVQQLEICRLITTKLGGGRALIVCPLGVRQEFARDARLIGVTTTFVRSAEEASADGIYLTNYETIRDGKLDPRGFEVISLDEAAVLRGFGGSKTFREFMRLYEGTANYRFVATATPSPNDFIELLAYAAFLDIMDVGQAKTRFFKRDSEHADKLTLLPHMEREFWLWCASWGLFLTRPSDLGHSDDGYELPPLNIVWHEVPSCQPGELDTDDAGQGRLFRNAAAGVQEAAREKRESIVARVALATQLAAEAADGGQVVMWADLNAEQKTIEQALAADGITAVSLYGSQPVDERETLIDRWRAGDATVFLSKPSMYGAGVNLQQSHTMIFSGIGYKFSELMQGIHRIHRYLQAHPCTVHLIFTEAEQEVRRQLERKWRQHDQVTARMGQIIRDYGLAHEAMAATLARSAGVERRETSGANWRMVNNDAVEECAATPDNSVGLIVTSVPFSSQYEYTPSFNDFGHSESNDAFWRQMDYLTPELFRILQPGRIAVIHVKDRVVPGGMTGLGFQTIYPFSDETIAHYRKHGFAFMARRTVVTDVVRENNQTYRLGWTEQCKDGTKMGAGLPEYLLIFRKPPTDSSRSYADAPVVKAKADYSRSRWQVDAHGFWREGGNRLLSAEDLADQPHERIFKLFRDHNLTGVYDYDAHIDLGEALERKRRLPTSFMLLQPPSWHPDVLTDIARMRTLNMLQQRKGKEQHLCPLPFGIAERVIAEYSMPGETVADPFAGIGTVPWMAVKLGRFGLGWELNPGYWADAVSYCQAAERELSVPTLFDLIGQESEDDGRVAS